MSKEESLCVTSTKAVVQRETKLRVDKKVEKHRTEKTAWAFFTVVSMHWKSVSPSYRLLLCTECLLYDNYTQCKSKLPNSLFVVTSANAVICNNSLTVVFSDEVQKKLEKFATSPQICCHTTLQNLSVQLYNCSFRI